MYQVNFLKRNINCPVPVCANSSFITLQPSLPASQHQEVLCQYTVHCLLYSTQTSRVRSSRKSIIATCTLLPVTVLIRPSLPARFCCTQWYSSTAVSSQSERHCRLQSPVLNVKRVKTHQSILKCLKYLQTQKWTETWMTESFQTKTEIEKSSEVLKENWWNSYLLTYSPPPLPCFFPSYSTFCQILLPKKKYKKWLKY